MPVDYIAQRIADVRTTGPKEGLFLFLATLAYYHVASFLCSESFLIFWALWGLNFVSGSALAIRSRSWRPRRAAESVGLFVLLLVPLAVAWLSRLIAFTGSGPFASSLELGLYLYYASSAIENVAHFLPEGSSLRVILEYFPPKLRQPGAVVAGQLIQATLATGEHATAPQITAKEPHQ